MDVGRAELADDAWRMVMMMFADWMVPGVARRIRSRRTRDLFEQPVRLLPLEPSMAERAPAPDGVIRTLRGHTTPVRRRSQLLRQLETWLQARPTQQQTRRAPSPPTRVQRAL